MVHPITRLDHFAHRSQELGQANKIVGGNAEDEHGVDHVEAAPLQLREPALSSHRRRRYERRV
jgi:hypothetical protein